MGKVSSFAYQLDFISARICSRNTNSRTRCRPVTSGASLRKGILQNSGQLFERMPEHFSRTRSQDRAARPFSVVPKKRAGLRQSPCRRLRKLHVLISNLRNLQAVYLAYAVYEAIIGSSLETLCVVTHSQRTDQEYVTAWIGHRESNQGV
jgi:hypothetical protein